MTQPCIVVTGASRGIGAAVAHQLAREGHRVVCLSRSGQLPQREEPDPVVRSRWLPMQCDVTQPSSVHAAFARMDETGLQAIGLVNNAGIHEVHAAMETTPEVWTRVMNANALSSLLVSQEAYPRLRHASRSLIVNIGSFFDKLGVRKNVAYCASKAAVAAVTRCLAVEWARDGIRVVNVAPGYILTDLNHDELVAGPLKAYLERRIPAGGPGRVEDVAEVVADLFQMSGQALTGTTIYVDGGQGIAH